MRAIRNYADFLIEDLADKVSGNQKQYLDRLKMAVAQGDALIDALLGFSRIGRAALENETLDLPDLVSEIRYILMPAADVEIHVDSTFPTVVADRILLKLILQNLIANAIKFNRSAPKRVAIGWQPAPGNRLDIHVRDNGIGIDPQYREKIFRIFQRLHNQRDYDGTGIGLAIVRKAAHLLGGTVQVASEPGKGSIFTVRLPKPSLENPSTRNSKP
jgi:signal transduction histidine kinase